MSFPINLSLFLDHRNKERNPNWEDFKLREDASVKEEEEEEEDADDEGGDNKEEERRTKSKEESAALEGKEVI